MLQNRLKGARYLRMGADPAAPDGFLAWVRRALQPSVSTKNE